MSSTWFNEMRPVADGEYVEHDINVGPLTAGYSLYCYDPSYHKQDRSYCIWDDEYNKSVGHPFVFEGRADATEWLQREGLIL